MKSPWHKVMNDLLCQSSRFQRSRFHDDLIGEENRRNYKKMSITHPTQNEKQPLYKYRVSQFIFAVTVYYKKTFRVTLQSIRFVWNMHCNINALHLLFKNNSSERSMGKKVNYHLWYSSTLPRSLTHPLTIKVLRHLPVSYILKWQLNLSGKVS